eukprot:7002123-Prymnesium_polylepis.1
MPIRRLTRTPALPAGSLSALLAPYGGAMQTEAHKSVARQCAKLCDSMLTCVRTGSSCRTVPSAEGTLESSPAA